MCSAGNVLDSNKLLPAAFGLQAVGWSQHVTASTTMLDHIEAWSRAVNTPDWLSEMEPLPLLSICNIHTKHWEVTGVSACVKGT